MGLSCDRRGDPRSGERRYEASVAERSGRDFPASVGAEERPGFDTLPRYFAVDHIVLVTDQDGG